MKHQNQLWLLVALLVAFGLRAYRLDAPSLWNDEGTSVALASLSVEAIVNGAARDIHPPLYYLLLHFWMPLAGNTEYAIRFLSVVAGVLVVALVFRVACFVFESQVAIIAAFFAAFSPFQVYYSQETRMYVWVMLWSAASVLAFTKFKVQSSRFKVQGSTFKVEPSAISHPPSAISHQPSAIGIWLIYLAATIAALYTHYFAATLLVAENLAFAVWWLVATRNTQHAIRPLAHWLMGQLVIALAFAPWLMFAGNQLAAWPSISEPFDLPTLLWQVLNVFSVGLTLEGVEATAMAVAFGILFLIGWLPSRNTWKNLNIITLILWTLVPVGAMYVVSLSRPAYNPKFLLLATPAFYILAARGLACVSRFTFHVSRFTRLSFAIGSFVILAFNLPSLINYYHDPRYARDDYRSVVRYIDANARAGDGILIDAPGQIDVVRYYHRGNQPLFLLPRMRPPDPAATRADVDEMLDQVTRLFAIYYATQQSDPASIIETRLAERAFKARDEWRGNVRLAIYGIAPTTRGAPQSPDAKFGDEITLASWLLDARAARAGDVLTLTLAWRAEQTPAARYKVFVHLLDAQNRVVAQRDGEPVGDTRLTTTWRAGERIADNYGVFVAPDTPPGEYRVEIGMYRADDGARLPIIARDGKPIGDHLILETVQVQ